MTSRDLDKYTKEIIQKYISTREVTLTNDTVMSYPGFLETLIMQVYKDGLKEGRDCLLRWKQLAYFVEWHDLQKNPNDLPDNKRNVWCDYGEGCGVGYYDKDDGGWWIEGHIYCSVIDAWCELPKRSSYV